MVTPTPANKDIEELIDESQNYDNYHTCETCKVESNKRVTVKISKAPKCLVIFVNRIENFRSQNGVW